MSDNDAPTVTFNLEPVTLMHAAIEALGLEEYDEFHRLIINQKPGNATEHLRKIEAGLKDPKDPELLQIKRRHGDRAYYHAVDERLEKLLKVSRLVAQLEDFLLSDDAQQVLAKYAKETLSQWIRVPG